MFREQFKLTAREVTALREFCIFAVTVYIKSWFTAPLPSCAPRNDLELLKDLHSYQNENISKATSAKLGLHLWYVLEDLVGLALFDSEVPLDTKRDMVKAMETREGENEPPKRIQIPARSVPQSRLDDCVTQNTKGLFVKLGIETDFLETDPDTWKSNESFCNGLRVIENLKVVNDNAERAVALMQEYNRAITHNEDQMQCLLQVVAEHHRQFPDTKKSTLIAPQLTAPE